MKDAGQRGDMDLGYGMNSYVLFDEEPIHSENLLLSIKNKHKLVMTPHIAWASIEARTELIEGVKSNIEEFLAG